MHSLATSVSESQLPSFRVLGHASPLKRSNGSRLNGSRGFMERKG